MTLYGEPRVWLEQGLPTEEMARLASRIDAALGEKNRQMVS